MDAALILWTIVVAGTALVSVVGLFCITFDAIGLFDREMKEAGRGEKNGTKYSKHNEHMFFTCGVNIFNRVSVYSEKVA